VPLSFSLHEQLAREHNGDQRWGYRRVRCGQLIATGTEPPKGEGAEAEPNKEEDRISLGKRDTAPRQSREELTTVLPPDLDWLAPETIDAFEDISDVDSTAQVQPYLFTNYMAKLAEERGVNVIMGTVEDINYNEDSASADTELYGASRQLPHGKSFSGRVVSSVTYRDNATSAARTIPATTIVLAAGPWTPTLFPWAPISALRAHSITIKVQKPLSSYCIFTEISLRGGNGASDDNDNDDNRSSGTFRTISPEILTRPNNEVYLCGSGDYTVPLPPNASEITISTQRTAELIDAASSISDDLRSGTVTSKRACYLPTVVTPERSRGPLVGETGVVGLLLAAGHSCWGVQNAPATGMVVSEIIFDGGPRSADVSELDPRRVL
jgi:hypothetical protein